MRRASPVSLTPLERAQLETWAASTSPSRLTVRARVVLDAALGRTNREIAQRIGVHRETVGRWRRRFAYHRLEGILRDAPRSGRRSVLSSGLAERILLWTAARPAPNRGRWTTRSLARALHVNHMVVHRVWRAHGLGGTVPRSVEALPFRFRTVRIDLAGLYVGRPANAIAFRVTGSGLSLALASVDRPHSISGAYRRSHEPRLSVPLAGFLFDVERRFPATSNRAPPDGSADDLLMFLRGIEEEPSAPATELRVIIDRPLDLLPARVTAWAGAGQRLKVTETSPESSWTATIDHWVRSFAGTRVDPESFRDAGSLLESSAASVASGWKGFCWRPGAVPLPSSGQAPPPRLRSIRGPNLSLP